MFDRDWEAHGYMEQAVAMLESWCRKQPIKDMVNAIDGVRVSTADGWWLLRASNTQAVLVARAESRVEAGLERLKGEIRRQLAAAGVDSSSVI
jgi:phosphomannomutase